VSGAPSPGDSGVATGAIRWECPGCGGRVAPPDLPVRCPKAGRGDVDHVLRRRLELTAATAASWRQAFTGDDEEQPFVRFRALLTSYELARAAGADDAEWVELARHLDAAVARVDGRGFRRTPFASHRGLATALGVGAARVKDETGNVGGSHKGRHLMGVMMGLEGARRWSPGVAQDAPLAIASCGNAALAAAVVARAMDRALQVFVPPHADPRVTARLERLGGSLQACPRRPGEAGDPCVLRFREAVTAGAFPFTCQGPENGLVIEGGETLAWEMVAELAAGGSVLDRLIVQVGGGALAAAVITGLEEALALGLVERLPRFHAVQTAGGWPLARAWDRLVEHLAASAGERRLPADRARRAAWVLEAVPATDLEAALTLAARHRSRFMQPWEQAPVSVAGGILDDETYDWLPVVAAMLRGGGHPLVVEEPTLRRAHRLARELTGIAVDATGAAGLAGALALRDEGALAATERLALLFTGAERG
jgi:threonine synthase